MEVDRERVIQALCSHYANDALTTQELEDRFAIANRATSPRELQDLLVSLPALPARGRLIVPPPAASPVAPAPGPASVASTREKRIVAFMSEAKRSGEWVPGGLNVVRAIMGSVHLDLREALLSQGEIVFDVSAIMGEVKFTVPPGLRVECEGAAIMGEFEQLHLAGTDDPGAPLVRIHGSAVMGAVRIKTRLPGESGMAAWRRRRLERGTL